jgi:hypothetical protein
MQPRKAISYTEICFTNVNVILAPSKYVLCGTKICIVQIIKNAKCNVHTSKYTEQYFRASVKNTSVEIKKKSHAHMPFFRVYSRTHCVLLKPE